MRSLAMILVCVAAAVFGSTVGGSARSAGTQKAPVLTIRTCDIAAEEVTRDYSPGDTPS